MIETIDAKTAKAWLDKNEAVIIDVREPVEYASQHIPGAKLIPLATIDTEHLKFYAEKKVIIHCQVGRRGGMACEKLLNVDPNLKLYNLEGGLTAWKNEQFPIEVSVTKGISIDRQVQIAIGLGVLLGVALGYFVSSAFLLLAAFFGGGLVYAGLSGTCTLALIMQKMPWNRG